MNWQGRVLFLSGSYQWPDDRRHGIMLESNRRSSISAGCDCGRAVKAHAAVHCQAPPVGPENSCMPLDATDTAVGESLTATRGSAPRDARDDEHGDIAYPSAIPLVLVHLACVAAIRTGITW